MLDSNVRLGNELEGRHVRAAAFPQETGGYKCTNRGGHASERAGREFDNSLDVALLLDLRLDFTLLLNFLKSTHTGRRHASVACQAVRSELICKISKAEEPEVGSCLIQACHRYVVCVHVLEHLAFWLHKNLAQALLCRRGFFSVLVFCEGIGAATEI